MTPHVNPAASEPGDLTSCLQELAQIQEQLPLLLGPKSQKSSCNPCQSAQLTAILQLLHQMQQGHQSILTVNQAVLEWLSAAKGALDGPLTGTDASAEFVASLQTLHQTQEALEMMLGLRQSIMEQLAIVKEADAGPLTALLQQLQELQKEYDSLHPLRQSVLDQLACVKEESFDATSDATRPGELPTGAPARPESDSALIEFRAAFKLLTLFRTLSQRYFGIFLKEDPPLEALAQLCARQETLQQET